MSQEPARSPRKSRNILNFDIGLIPYALIPFVSLAAVYGVYLQTHHDLINRHYISALIIGFLVIQSLMIIGLQRSRIKYKLARKDLKRHQHELERRVIERTEKLHTINNQLYNEIAKHEITEELLQETQDYLNSIIHSMPSILIGVTREGIITHWNAAASLTTNITDEDALGQPLHLIYPDIPIAANAISEVIDSGVPQTIESLQQSTGPNTCYCDVTIYPLLSADITGAVIRIDDVSMRVRVENLMIQNEKMMSLGELAAGAAHEINNPLSAILHGLQNISRRTSADLPKNHEVANDCGITIEQLQHYLETREIFKFIDSIREAGERAARIVTNMLEFSRSNSRRHLPIAIVGLLEHSLELAANSLDLQIGEQTTPVTIIKEFSDKLPQVMGSATEIQQVILNLLRNACQAFSDSELKTQFEPTITLRAYQQETLLCIEVEDNGPGMTAAIRKHIFEPFFTTKEVGKGTGLGLSVSYFIITEHHHGSIDVESTTGSGTRFIIKLPLDYN